MKELIKDKLYSFDEKVRVELGPRIIQLDCTEENLSNEVTHPNYKIGGVDAYGEPITEHRVSANNTTMWCVDWQAKHVSHMWKIYQLQETTDKDKKGKPIFRFIKMDEVENKDEAFTIAESILGEMK